MIVLRQPLRPNAFYRVSASGQRSVSGVTLALSERQFTTPKAEPPPDSTRRAPGDTTRRVPNDTTRRVPNDTTRRVPNDTTRRVPNDTARRVPGRPR
ncbi:hypothetical protein J421_2992 [Gemmatirosa kalamazoonensis]|uniref:Uncharacterized protein n=1 Tax=Gemmatirosa kalamazoonensis TaxID=861299 RepID=W0RHC7_9BACT|nr:hypothetical protein J421_2992 [Gemmatirosa kalamazoonensis]